MKRKIFIEIKNSKIEYTTDKTQSKRELVNENGTEEFSQSNKELRYMKEYLRHAEQVQQL